MTNLTVSGEVSSITREKNSLYGNPRWTIKLTNGFTGKTKPNGDIAYVITGQEKFLSLSYHVTPTGRIVITDAE